ncbi:hypothetical protein [Gluconobacter oxydans]|uniref:hypothetical protein n=1 Tax=Gluconobacter oxydans TaxID=442 RepID=UPI001559AD61|nr:hypothetical protein [Gluconobacter oxydans]
MVLLDRIELSTSPLPKHCFTNKIANIRESIRPKMSVLSMLNAILWATGTDAQCGDANLGTGANSISLQTNSFPKSFSEKH